MDRTASTLAQRIAALLPDGGARWLADAGVDRAEALLGRLPPAALQAGDPLRCLILLRDLASQAGDHGTAVATGRAVVSAVTALRGRAHEDVAFETAGLGVVLDRAGSEEGLRLLQGAVDQVGGLRGAIVAQHLGGALARTGRYPQALGPLLAAYEGRKRHAPETLALAAAQVGEVLQKLGRTPDALPYLEEAWIRTRDAEGPTSPRALARAHVYGTACNAVDRFADAVSLLRPVFAHLPAEDLERRASVGFELGLALERTGASEEAIRRIDEAVRLTRQVGGPHPELANRLVSMAQIHLRRGRAAEAEGLYLEALEAERTLHGDASAEVAAQYAQLGHFCYRTGRPAEAAGWMDSATSLVETALGPRHPQTVAVADAHVALLLELAESIRVAEPDYARDLLRHAVDIGVRLLGPVHERTRRARDALERPRVKVPPRRD